ncbi:MAG TPA: VWA domain-containing protein, partial [Spirochaetota bacterium]|nr:VWA domain-containing protein [Spirochaetota bacterium]
MITERDDRHGIKNKFFDFAKILQDAGVTISTVEVLDMFTALRHVNPYDREIFRQALAITMVKDYTDIPVFDRCFSEFFDKRSGQKGFDFDIFLRDAQNSESARERLGMDEADRERLMEEIDLLVDTALAENPEKTPQEIIKLLLDEPQASSASGALGQLLFNVRSRNSEASADADMFGRGEKGPSGEGDDFLAEMVRERVRRRVFEKTSGRAINRRDEYLLHRYIYRLTPAEVKEMRDLITRFGQKLKNRISIRKKRVKHGGIDVKRTLRKNMQYGGTPFRIFHKDRKIDRPQLVVLCDISSSVSQYSRFMLLLAHTLQSLFSKVRSFAFISNMVEITHLFMEMDPERAVNSIFSDTNFTYGWGSNYGRCFTQFVREYGDSLTSKTTVLVLGDARNNNQDPGLDSFIRIGERCRNLFWLNPDRRHLWAWSDSIAELYLPHCKEMKEVRNFLDLSDFIDKLFVR